jgi:hypothetical protein
VAYTRLAPNAGCVLIGTPWHADDLLGYLPREHAEQGWRVLRLPALAEEDDPLGRKPGEPLWPEKHDAAQLEQIRRQMGSAGFVSLMQLRPSAAEGTIFKADWFRYFQQPWPSFSRTLISLDTSYGKGTRSGDFSAATVWGVNQTGIHLLHLWHERADFPRLLRTIAELTWQWGHEYTPENTYIHSGHRYCRECARSRQVGGRARVVPYRRARQRARAQGSLFAAE